MEFHMEVNRLAQDELIYELHIRGVTGIVECEVRRKTLRSLLKLEKSNTSLTHPDYPYTYEQDLEALTATIAELRTLITPFSDNSSSSAFKKISTKTAHAFGRADRMKAETAEQRTSRSQLVVQLITLWSDVKCKAKSYVRSSTLQAAGVLDISSSAIERLALSTDSDSDVDPVPVQSETRVQSKLKVVLPSQWSLHFTAEPKSLSLGAFLERVEELRIARNVSKPQLFASCVDLFKGKALVWYRANRNQFVNWDSLVERLREVFQPPDYDDRLFEEIKHRTQGPDETMDIYVATMQTMFRRLTTPVSEATKLRIMMRNINPYFQQLLGLTDVDSVECLLKLCRRLEHRRAAINAYVPPSRNYRALEPDLAYVGVSSQNNSHDQANLESTSATTCISPIVSDNRHNRDSPAQHTSRDNNASRPNTVQCWNCGTNGHRSATCSQPRNRHCYRCGKPNVTVKTCPVCNKSENLRTRH